MKKLLVILLLFSPVHGAWGIDKIKSYWCKKKAAKAKTELAANRIIVVVIVETNLDILALKKPQRLKLYWQQIELLVVVILETNVNILAVKKLRKLKIYR